MSKPNNSPMYPAGKATFFSICFVVSIFFIIIGILLYSLSIIPSSIATTVSGLSALVTLLAAIVFKDEKIPIKEIWGVAKHRQVVIYSPIVIVLISIIILSIVSLIFDPYVHKGTLELNAPLNNGQDMYDWEQDNIDPATTSSCIFTHTGYQVSESTTARLEPITFCQAKNTSFPKFVYEVQMKIIKGDVGGIRLLDAAQNAYYFGLQQNGSFDFREYMAPSYIKNVVHCGNPLSNEVTCGNTKSFRTGLKQINKIAIIKNDNYVDLYVNYQNVGRAYITINGNCQIGVFARRENTPGPTIVEFSNARVWRL